jgi:hypothetical protein
MKLKWKLGRIRILQNQSRWTNPGSIDYVAFASKAYKDYIATMALVHQTEIGWMNATRGFLAKAWHHVACTQLETSGPNGIQHSQRNDGQPRVYHVVCKLHAMVTDIWKGRNEALHRCDQENAVLQRCGMDAEIARIHCAPSALPAADQH